MKQNTTREKIAWLAVLTLILMTSFGIFKLADAAQSWLAEDAAVEEAALQRPAPARNDAPLPADIQRQKQQMQKQQMQNQQIQQANPGGWATGGPAMKFRPGPAFDEYFDGQQNRNSTPMPPVPQPEQNRSKKQHGEKPQYRGADPDESMEEFWKPDYYDEGLDL